MSDAVAGCASFGRCGENPSALPAGRVGCGEPFADHEKTYRCTDCDTVFHRACAQVHFGTHVAGMVADDVKRILAQVARGAVLVSSSGCSHLEIAVARMRGRFLVDAEGLGYLVKTPPEAAAWLLSPAVDLDAPKEPPVDGAPCPMCSSR